MYLKLVSAAPDWYRVIGNPSLTGVKERELYGKFVVMVEGVPFVDAAGLRAMSQSLGRYSFGTDIFEAVDVEYSSQVILSKLELQAVLFERVREFLLTAGGEYNLVVSFDEGFMSPNTKMVVKLVSPPVWSGDVFASSHPHEFVVASYSLRDFRGMVFVSEKDKIDYLDKEVGRVIAQVEAWLESGEK